VTKRQRQQALLAVLAVLLLIAGGRRLSSIFTAGDAGGGASGARTVSRSGEEWRAMLPLVEELQVEALAVESDAYSEGRDPFEIGRPAPAPQPRPSAEELRRRIEAARQQRTAEVKPAPRPPPGPRPPAIDVVYLGSFGSEETRLAVFTDGSEIFNVPEGETLKDKFVVVKIGMESADVGFVGFPNTPAKRLEIGG
jgi:hypothetical protein